MLLAMVAQFYRRDIAVCCLLLVEGPHALTAVGHYLDASVVNLTQSLDLNVVAPNTECALSLAILLYSFIFSDKCLKVSLLSQNILHALLSH